MLPGLVLNLYIYTLSVVGVVTLICYHSNGLGEFGAWWCNGICCLYLETSTGSVIELVFSLCFKEKCDTKFVVYALDAEINLAGSVAM